MPAPSRPLPCPTGCVITISGRMTFTSNKSMEIEVLVDADPVVDNSQKRYRAASAFFTYVSLSQEGKPLPVPQLVVSARVPFSGSMLWGGCEHGVDTAAPSGDQGACEHSAWGSRGHTGARGG